MSSLLTIALLAAIATVVVLLPFLSRREPPPRRSLREALEELRRRREDIYRELESVELERQLERGRSADQERHIQSLRMEAASALREQERLEEALSRQDAVLEAEVLELRCSRWQADGTQRCPHCHRQVLPGAQWCAGCGNEVSASPKVDKESQR
jgi:hypothetical protein